MAPEDVAELQAHVNDAHRMLNGRGRTKVAATTVRGLLVGLRQIDTLAQDYADQMRALAHDRDNWEREATRRQEHLDIQSRRISKVHQVIEEIEFETDDATTPNHLVNGVITKIKTALRD